ncbi:MULTISPECIES: ABC transporter ATP-binding protein [Paenibacillus]|uniref:Amino acid/amide ABC transporter ATP-binding protein 1, HAAT family n=1 Tax=Paenibacillus typhae TaxID=1174501 RepID=A0A1G9HHL7_9BACL|nr:MULTISPECIES: ABC transporter ATP-binding protein [Paenibacillus]KUP25328.1 ABC transporter ATP-binding protein [Paenibacillus sp. DMB5]MBY0013273.1 ABC transporter ATP-binding protein [Paenibacillus typhae]SDL11993.1 amino acid/amide ABC transporter ATP-binding protein 1, HAAT family [Paenibacillus typhae]
MAASTAVLLDVKGASRSFGGLKALSEVSLHINKGELIGLIGPNGAGKTTLFNLLTGVYPPSTGKILLNNESVGGMKPFKINHKGAARTFQNIRLFTAMTVLENVKIAFHQHARHSLFSSMLRLPKHFKGEEEITQKAMDILKIFNLADQAQETAGNLSYGNQRRLEIARALAAGPKLLLLDEPAAGMNPNETRDLMNLIAWIREEFDLTILLIEHDMSLVMGVCNRIYVLDRGILIADGTPVEIRNNPKVIEAYLGQEA